VLDDEGVVPDRLKCLGHPGEQPAPVVLDRAQAPVHRLARVLHPAARHERERLVAQAHAEYGDPRAPQRIERYADVARVLRAAGAGGDHDVVDVPALDLRRRQRVVVDDERLLAVDLIEQMEEVERVRVVVVDQQGSHPGRGIVPPAAG
jgi:hypothetical protein